MSAAAKTMLPPVLEAGSGLRKPHAANVVGSGKLATSVSADQEPQGKHIVHWFRKGLRLHDNPALRHSLVGATTFRCVFIIDPWFASSSNVGINKWRFLLQCLEDLDSSLRKLNSRLFVVRGQPADVLPKLFREWGTTDLCFEEDPEPFGRVRDNNIVTMCREFGITVLSKVSHTLFSLDKIIKKNGGKAPLTYHQFQALIASMPPPANAEPSIDSKQLNGATTPVGTDHDDRFGVPTLEQLGFETEDLKPAVWVGGESEALTRLKRHLERKAWVASFGRPKMTPQSLLASPTGLSPYLRFGCLSTRLFYYQLTELYKRVKRVRPPLSLHGQLLWREFFYCAATRNPNFDRMVGNPICVQIPWDNNQEALAKWASGQTGYPWIDAIMIQLREEGWIHHLARHAVACFLTRGDLWISWEEGMKVFDELLLDADWSVNAGMWMWLSCSSFFQQFFHCYCPVRFGRKADPNGDFIRKYIPVLKNIPTQYIHEPWMAPEEVQRSARCVVGQDYPMPMVEHAKASQANIDRIRQVYAQLAKFKPQGLEDHTSQNVSLAGAVTAQIIQRSNMAQSSPSPTSVITSINQSNYLCSRTPDPQNVTLNVPKLCKITEEYESNDIFNTSNNNASLSPGLVKSAPFKQDPTISEQIYVKHDPSMNNDNLAYQNNTTSKNNQQADIISDSREIINQINKANSQDHYNMKNLAINNEQVFSSNKTYQTLQPANPNDVFKMTYYNNKRYCNIRRVEPENGSSAQQAYNQLYNMYPDPSQFANGENFEIKNEPDLQTTEVNYQNLEAAKPKIKENLYSNIIEINKNDNDQSSTTSSSDQQREDSKKLA